ncbi:glycosyltransferase [Acinetobacter lwoffii]|jgi:glycosyltransferase involved in cell wall biosynthesis|uniref:glycosyltransferase n=1 Tax=Acinetobacter lwoffii TaxID=28090 RepID=UPI00209B1BBD|nr:glycosyltransferase [Acinetobacter lwoffii]MCO8114708.1 glycosyltransferase [Acinetobacter lwoffii]
MKILYVITGLGQGGAERVVCDLADQMHQRGHSVKIAYLTGDVFTKPRCPEIELIKINLNSLWLFPLAYIKLSKVIRIFKPDVVHSHMVHANIFTRLVRITTSIKKLICTAHNSDEGGRWRMLAYRFTHNLADLTTNVSNEAVQAFIEKKAVPDSDIITTYNGIDLSRFFYNSEAKNKILNELNININSYLILAVGRFSEQKDYPNLLQAFKTLKNKSTGDIKLIIAGDGELRSEIESIIDELGLKQEVFLLGRRNDIPDLMSAADLFVLSSKYEGFGLVVAEAMACNTLVVATDCGGVAEVLNNDDFLVPTSNSKALADKMCYALTLDEKQKSENIIKNIRHVEQNFSLEEKVKQWIHIYHE